MRYFINNNKVMLSLWLALALFFSLIPNQAMGKENDSPSVLSEDTSSKSITTGPAVIITTGPAVMVNKVKICTGSSLTNNCEERKLVYNGEEQDLVTGINIELSEENNTLTENDININWRTELLEQPTATCPPLCENDWKTGNGFSSDILPAVNAGHRAIYCRVTDRNNNMIATGGAVACIKRCPVKLKWDSSVKLPYNNNKKYQTPGVNIEDSKTKEIFTRDKCMLKTKYFNLSTSPEKEIEKKDCKAVGKYRVTAYLQGKGDKKEDNYVIDEVQSSCDYTIVPKLKKESVDFIWGKDWGTKKERKELIDCDEDALNKIKLSVTTSKTCIQEKENGKYIKVGKRKWNRKIKPKTSISFSVELTGVSGVSWNEKVSGVIKFPGFSNAKEIVKRRRKGNLCKYKFKYNVKKDVSPYAKSILVKVSGVKKNKQRINAVLKKFVSGYKSKKNSYLKLLYPTKKKAKKSKVTFKICILYGKNCSKVQKVRK